ncbi:hypothetical protein N9C85_01080 [Synechococcus sp. AH-224-I15]|nr:hypothetical protein [Synechococcus sp. AH-224-I15]
MDNSWTSVHEESVKILTSLATSGVFVEAGNALSSCLLPMTLDTQMTLDLLQELLMALRANDSDGYKSWLAIGIEQLGRDVAGEVESDWMVPFLVEEERERLMAWHFRRKSP